MSKRATNDVGWVSTQRAVILASITRLGLGCNRVSLYRVLLDHVRFLEEAGMISLAVLGIPAEKAVGVAYVLTSLIAIPVGVFLLARFIRSGKRSK